MKILKLGHLSTDRTKIKANVCSNGEVLTRKREYEYNDKIQYHYYGANCEECEDRVQSRMYGTQSYNHMGEIERKQQVIC